MHVAFALMIGWPLARLVRRRVVEVLWLLYPFLMAFVIVVTANHFIFDALLGALTAGASASAREPARPHPTRRVAFLEPRPRPAAGEQLAHRWLPRQRASSSSPHAAAAIARAAAATRARVRRSAPASAVSSCATA